MRIMAMTSVIVVCILMGCSHEQTDSTAEAEKEMEYKATLLAKDTVDISKEGYIKITESSTSELVASIKIETPEEWTDEQRLEYESFGREFMEAIVEYHGPDNKPSEVLANIKISDIPNNEGLDYFLYVMRSTQPGYNWLMINPEESYAEFKSVNYEELIQFYPQPPLLEKTLKNFGIDQQSVTGYEKFYFKTNHKGDVNNSMWIDFLQLDGSERHFLGSLSGRSIMQFDQKPNTPDADKES